VSRQEITPHWGSDREPSDSFESVRFDSRSPNFLREVRFSYYSVCVDNVTFDRDYVGDSKKTVRDFQKGNNLRVTEVTVERPPAGTIKQRSNKVATPHPCHANTQPLLVGLPADISRGISGFVASNLSHFMAQRIKRGRRQRCDMATPRQEASRSRKQTILIDRRRLKAAIRERVP
jgi:hypothetical protein